MTEQELTDLDLAVAKAEGFECELVGYAHAEGRRDVCIANWRKPDYLEYYQPTRDPAEAMRLQIENKVTVIASGHGDWIARPRGKNSLSYGKTPAIAICRAVIALKGKGQ